MLQLIEAPPRSGKSYFAVNYLVSFTKFDDLYQEYILKDDVLIISNIAGLKLKHWTLNHCLGLKPHQKLSQAESDKIKEFFSIENFEKIMDKTRKRHIILAIDEVHEIFPAGYKDNQVYEFFALHGHLGLDVIFMTQGLDSMSRIFNPLLEFIVKATPRSKKISKTFSYRYVDLRGKYLYSKVIPCKQSVFKAYKSFRHDESNKPRSAVAIWAVLVICIFIGAGLLFRMALGNISDKAEAGEKKNAQVKSKDIDSDKSEIGSASVGLSEKVASSPPEKTPEVVPEEWILYYIEGYIKQGSKLYYLINGEALQDGPRFRNFDRLSKTVEYFGPDIRRKEKPRPFAAPDVAPVEVGGGFDAEAEPLGGATSGPVHHVVKKPTYPWG